MNRTLLILVLSLFMSLESNSQVYQAVGTFVNTKNIKIGKVDIMEQGDGSNLNSRPIRYAYSRKRVM